MVSSEIRAEARKSLTGKWGKAALLTLVFGIITYLINFVLGFVPVLGPVASLVITPALSFGYLVGFIKLKRNEEVGYIDFFTNGFAPFGKIWAVIGNTLLKMILPVVAFIVSIVILVAGGITSIAAGGDFGFIALLGFILYIASLVWIIVKGLSYSLTSYILYDNPDMPAKDIVEKSEELMNGHKGQYFWLPFTFLGWIILSVFTLYIGMLWVIPYMQISLIIFYENLTGTSAKADKIEE